MKCVYDKNPGCGYVGAHTSPTCLYNHQPVQPVTFHIHFDHWCANVCWYCKDLLKKKNPKAEVTPLPPWERPQVNKPWKGLE